MRTLLPVLVCVALAACGGLSRRATVPLAPTTPGMNQRLPAYVVKRGWHIDIGIALRDARPSELPVAAAFRGSRYLLFGFGDRRYLLQGGAGNMVAALWGDAGLVLVTSLEQQPPEQVFGEDSVITLALTPQQMSDLQAFIGRTFALHDGALVPITPGPHAVGAYSAYYESAQRYSALHTCNTWAAEALRSAQLPVSSSGIEFAWQLWDQVRRLQTAGAETAHPVAAAGRPRPALRLIAQGLSAPPRVSARPELLMPPLRTYASKPRSTRM